MPVLLGMLGLGGLRTYENLLEFIENELFQREGVKLPALWRIQV